MILLFIGPSGSGKDTQAEILADKYRFSVVSTGSVLRGEIEEGTADGLSAEEAMSAGRWVEDTLMFRVLGRHLRKSGWSDLVLTGAVRTEVQIQMLDDLLTELGTKLDKVVYFELDDEEAERRMLARGREDDTKELVRARLTEFHQTFQPIISAYESRGILVRIDAAPAIPEVTKELLAKLQLK